MKKIIILFFFIVITIVGLIFYFKGFNFIGDKGNKEIKQEIKENRIEQNILEAWIEIVIPKIYEIAENGFVIRELKTGDIVKSGAYLKTDAKGRANVRFPDGSVLRIEENTMTKIKESKFNNKTDSLMVKVELMIGRVWSKIIELTTPESIWEVKTSNAVATVRGTAFGMEYGIDKKSRIIGSENKVEVDIINPQTKKIILSRLEVGAKKIFEIDNETIQKVEALLDDEDAIKKVKVIINIKDITKEVLAEEWVQRSENEDNKLRQKIEQLEEKGLRGDPLRREIKKEIFEEYKIKIQETRPDIKEVFERGDIEATQDKSQELKIKAFQKISSPPSESNELKSNIIPVAPIKPDIPIAPIKPDIPIAPIKPDIPVAPIKPDIPIAPIKPDIPVAPINTILKENIIAPLNFTIKDKLIVTTKTTNFTIFEGNTINFEAVLIKADGTRVIVTNNVIWRVVGQVGELIGTITPRGVFTANLEQGISEAGVGYGVVIATIKSNDLKSELVAKSPYITVNAKLDANIISPADIGGQ